MPPQARFTKEEIVQAALALVREAGAQALTARALGERLGSSARPIFTVFPGMDEVRQAVIAEAAALYGRLTREELAGGRWPPYKASGIAYIRFAREERELFRLLFMRDRSQEDTTEAAGLEAVYTLIRERTGVSAETAELFHLEMWSMVHGVAVMHATGYLTLPDELVSDMLTDVFQGLCRRFSERKEGTHGRDPNGRPDQTV